jgi:hypothetical protein
VRSMAAKGTGGVVEALCSQLAHDLRQRTVAACHSPHKMRGRGYRNSLVIANYLFESREHMVLRLLSAKHMIESSFEM